MYVLTNPFNFIFNFFPIMGILKNIVGRTSYKKFIRVPWSAYAWVKKKCVSQMLSNPLNHKFGKHHGTVVNIIVLFLHLWLAKFSCNYIFFCKILRPMMYTYNYEVISLILLGSLSQLSSNWIVPRSRCSSYRWMNLGCSEMTSNKYSSRSAAVLAPRSTYYPLAGWSG